MTLTSTVRTRCPGSGKPGINGADLGKPSYASGPFCPDCGGEFTAQGRKHRYSQTNPWIAQPLHYRSKEVTAS